MVPETGNRIFPADLPLEKIPQAQAELLKRFVIRARGSTSYYGNQFEKLLASEEAYFLDRWRDMPILTKYDVRDEFDRLAAASIPLNSGKISTHYTTGSTGTPIKFLRTTLSEKINSEMNARLLRTWELDEDKSFLIQLVRGVSEGTFFRSGVRWHPGGGTGIQGVMSTGSIDEHLKKVIEFRPAYLKSYPLTIASQAELARELGVELHFDLIISNGSVLPNWVRQLCREVFSSRIVDLYGTKEAGLIAYECMDCGDFHMFFDNVFAELIKDDGEPAAPGESGRVIITPFHNDAMPLVRFDIGDRATRGTGVGRCAEQSFTLKDIVGRVKSNFVKPDGSIFYPRMSHEKAVKAGIKRYRIIQIDRQRVELHYFPVASEIVPDDALIDLLRDQIGSEFSYTLNRTDRIENLNHPKLLTFESLVDQARADD